MPVYINKHWADLIGKTLRNKPCDDVIDADIEGWIKGIQDSGGKVALLIEEDNGNYRAMFIGQGCEVECGVGKGLAVAARGGVGILPNNHSYHETV